MLATFIVLFLLAELDCQSKLFFSSVAVFSFCNRRGALSSAILKDMFAADFVAELSKTGRNMISKGFKPTAFLSSPVCAAFHCPSHCLLIILNII